MKKVIMIALMAASVSLSAMAQEQGQRGRNFDPTEMAQRRTDMMAERYGLDQGQKEKLLELNKKYPGMGMMGPRMGGQRPGGGGDRQMRRQGPPQGNGNNQQGGQMQGQRPGFGPGQGGPGRGPGRFNPEQMKEYEEALKGILTDEQYQKYEADRKERMERMQQRRQQQ
ncbi:MAG: DUF4890 domain-containing protein [Prevotella sp.]|nr:DUF4890 domain-containing protein [Prevotella sp.]